MVDRNKIENLIRHLGRYTEYLRVIAKIEREEFLRDPLAVGSARYYLLASVESCIDIANHIIATERLRSPTDYKDTFLVLNEAGIIPSGFTRTMQSLAGLRNLLVHLYWEVDDQMLFDGLTGELGDFETYTAHILQFIEAKA